MHSACLACGARSHIVIITWGRWDSLPTLLLVGYLITCVNMSDLFPRSRGSETVFDSTQSFSLGHYKTDSRWPDFSFISQQLRDGNSTRWLEISCSCPKSGRLARISHSWPNIANVGWKWMEHVSQNHHKIGKVADERPGWVKKLTQKTANWKKIKYKRPYWRYLVQREVVEIS